MLDDQKESIIEAPDLLLKDYLWFEQEFEKLAGIDLRFYKEKQMKRRINTLIERKGAGNYENFFFQLQNDSVKLASFIDYITINVTEFFRTPEHWACLEKNVLSDLLCRNKKLKIWSTACATGEEPYSLAMSLLQQTDTSRFHIIATDLDEKVIRFAKKGVYSQASVQKLPEEVRKRFFVETSDGLCVSEDVKNCVEFRKMDMLKDEYPTECDLIVCRNVLIYFTEEAKEKIYSQFGQSLCSGGWLFTGNTEQLIYYKKYGFQKQTGFLYRNVGT